jgi:GNAT superfamily N-acetyltransferase
LKRSSAPSARIDPFYEPLSTWDETVAALRLARLLHVQGADEYHAQVDSVYCARPAFAGLSRAMDERYRSLLCQSAQQGGVDYASLARAWHVPNPRLLGTMVLCGVRHERWRREVISLRLGSPVVDAIELVLEGELVGRVHLVRAGRDADTAVIEELWVAPGRRRRGYGTALERETAGLAAACGARRLRLPLFEADAGPTNQRRRHQLALAARLHMGHERCGTAPERRAYR